MTLDDGFSKESRALVVTSDRGLCAGLANVDVVDSMDLATEILKGGSVSLLVMDATIEDTMFSSYELCRYLRRNEINVPAWEMRNSVLPVYESIFERYGGKGVIERERKALFDLFEEHGIDVSVIGGGRIEEESSRGEIKDGNDGQGDIGRTGLSQSDYDLLVGNLSVFVGPVAPMIVETSVNSLGRSGSKITLGAVVRMAMKEVPAGRQAEFSRMF